MKINVNRFELALARACKTARQLRNDGVAQQTIQRMYLGKNMLPSTVGRIARALGVDPAELIEEEKYE